MTVTENHKLLNLIVEATKQQKIEWIDYSYHYEANFKGWILKLAITADKTQAHLHIFPGAFFYSSSYYPEIAELAEWLTNYKVDDNPKPEIELVKLLQEVLKNGPKTIIS